MNTQNDETTKHDIIVSFPHPVVPDTLTPERVEVSIPPATGTAPVLYDDSPAALHRRRTFAIQSLERQQRADSFFHALTSEQKEQLLLLAERNESLGAFFRLVNSPPPDGFGLNVHLTSLRRLRSHWQAVQRALQNEEILDTVQDMEDMIDLSQTHRIQRAVNQVLHEKLFELAHILPASETIPRILTSIEKLSALDFKRQKLLLEREKILRRAGTPRLSPAETPALIPETSTTHSP